MSSTPPLSTAAVAAAWWRTARWRRCGRRRSCRPGATNESPTAVAEPVEHENQTVGQSLDVATQLSAANDRIRSLEYALVSSRKIGAAIGIVMATQRCTEQAAFYILSGESQRRGEKLRDVADDIVYTGAVPDVPVEN